VSSGHPDARTFAADRLLESERMALAVAAGPLALLVTQLGTIAALDTPFRLLATLSFVCFAYCCIWQVHIISFATYWLAAARLAAADTATPGRDLLDSFGARDKFTEAGLTRLIRRSTWHYTLSYWAGGISGALVVLAAIWT
jgi:hypothetical protein